VKAHRPMTAAIADRAARYARASPLSRLVVKQALEGGGFDEIIISTLPARVSHWLRRDLPVA
jgi:hypothetical protein